MTESEDNAIAMEISSCGSNQAAVVVVPNDDADEEFVPMDSGQVEPAKSYVKDANIVSDCAEKILVGLCRYLEDAEERMKKNREVCDTDSDMEDDDAKDKEDGFATDTFRGDTEVGLCNHEQVFWQVAESIGNLQQSR